MRRLRSNRNGSALLITALFIPALMGIAALMIDMGIAFAAKSRLEHAVVEAAEAGEARLPDEAAAQALAESLIEDLMDSVNIYTGSPQWSVTASAGRVTVSASVDSPIFFAAIFGANDISVSAEATRPIY